MNLFFSKMHCLIVFSILSLLVKSAPNDSLQSLILKTKNDSIKADLYWQFALKYTIQDQKNYFFYLNKAIEHAKQGKNDWQITCLVYYKGSSYFNLGQYTKSIEANEEYLKLGEKRKDIKQIAKAYQRLAISYKYWGKYSKALDYCQKSLDIYTKISDNSEIGQSYNIMSWIYEAWNDFENAEKYGYIAYRQLYPLGESYSLAYTQLVLANCKLHKDSFDLAFKLFNDAEKQFFKLNDSIGAAYVFRDKGKFYLKQKNIDFAQKYIDSAIMILEANKNIRGLSEVYVFKGRLYAAKKNYPLAISFINKGLAIAKEIDLQEDIVSDLRILAETYAQSGDLKNALKYERLYSDTRDSVFSKTQFEQLSDLRTRYETDQKEKELIVQKSLVLKQRILLLVLGLLILLAIAFVLSLYKQYKLKKRSNQLLSQQKAEIDASNKKLRELDEVKTRFFSNISHEFRTPLTLIMGPAEQLREELEDAKHNSSASLIVRNALRLQELINQLLDISRLERGNMGMYVQCSDLAAFVRTRVSLFSSLAEERAIQFSYSIPDEPQLLYFDADKLEKITYNLLSNAFKYTNKGGQIKVSFLLSSDKQRFQLVFSDTGKGISQDELPYIFDRFFQSNQSVATQNSSGIGLALVKELVDLYKGKISVVSELNAGSTFSVELPCSVNDFSPNEITKNEIVKNEAIGEYMNAPILENVVVPGKSTAPLLLVVEDNADMRQYIVSNLYNDFRIIEACNGKEGYELALDENPDIIISDIMMPEMDGYQLASTIKSNSQTSHIPLILLTAKAAEESLLKGFENDADDYLTKPFSVKELKARALNLIRSRERLKEKFSKSLVVNPTEITTSSLDEQFLLTALKAVENNMDNPNFTAEMFCIETGVSRANMHRKLKALTNQSATEFIRSIRLKRAAQLLQQKSGNVSEIAASVGFNTLSYFSACFKEEFNCLPSEYSQEQNKPS